MWSSFRDAPCRKLALTPFRIFRSGTWFMVPGTFACLLLAQPRQSRSWQNIFFIIFFECFVPEKRQNFALPRGRTMGKVS